MPIFDTTNVLDNSIFLKSNLSKNYVSENHYLRDFQDKRNQDWGMRFNVVEIEEELEKQIDYSKFPPSFTPIDVAVRSVKSLKYEDFATDWINIAFRDLNHPCGIGSRYRFPVDMRSYEEVLAMSEEEKKYATCIWIAINKSAVGADNDIVIRRCNCSLAFAGIEGNNQDNPIKEVHYEPGILESDLKYINTYYNQTVPVPQAEWYITMQLNYFTQFVNINNRFIIGGVDMVNRDNNAVYKVKAVVKSLSDLTFQKEGSNEAENIPLVVIALDKDVIGPTDDLKTRLASSCPIYPIGEEMPTYEYYIKKEKFEDKILQGETATYKIGLWYNEKRTDADFKIEFDLIGRSGKSLKTQNQYYKAEVGKDGEFSITNIKQSSGVLQVKCTCRLKDSNYMPLVDPYGKGIEDDYETMTETFEVELGGFY